MEEALFLTNFASQVTLVHRRNELRAEKILQKKLFDHPKINVIWDSEIKEIMGKDSPPSVESIIIKNVKTDEENKLEADGVLSLIHI